MYVSWSELTEMEWIWYAWALEYTFLGTAATMLSCCCMRGNLSWAGCVGGATGRWPSRRFDSETTRNDFSNTFHSLIVLSGGNQYTRTHPEARARARTVGREQEVCSVLPFAPLDLVDLLLDLERLEVVEFRFVRLELGVELVFAAFFLCVS